MSDQINQINSNHSNSVRSTELEPMQQNFNNQQNMFELLKVMLSDPNLKSCYKCKQDFSKVINDQNQQDTEETDSNNILFGGIVLSQKTPCSICLKCLSFKMLDVITDQFTKNNKDYFGLFSTYKEKYKV